MANVKCTCTCKASASIQCFDKLPPAPFRRCSFWLYRASQIAICNTAMTFLPIELLKHVSEGCSLLPAIEKRWAARSCRHKIIILCHRWHERTPVMLDLNRTHCLRFEYAKKYVKAQETHHYCWMTPSNQGWLRVTKSNTNRRDHSVKLQLTGR